MKADDHLKAFQEHKDTINWAVDRGVEKSQRIIGTHASRCIVELLSAYLHRINKIDIGFQINHSWFKSSKAGERFSDFPKKDTIIPKMIELENKSESLTYGMQKSEEEIKEVIELSNEIEAILKELMKNEE
jgi:hypothetical protein